MKNVQFRSRSRKTKILTTGIHGVFRGLKFSSDVEIGRKGTFCKGLDKNVVMCICLVMCFVFLAALTGTADFNREVFAQVAQKDRPELNVFNRYDKTIGSVDTDGIVSNRYGKAVGSVDPAGTVYNVRKRVIGKVHPNGKVFNQTGTELGSVDREGRVYNRNGRVVGSVDINGDIILTGGAARLLLLKS